MNYKKNTIDVVLSEPVVIDKTLVSPVTNFGFNVTGNTIESVRIINNKVTIVCHSNIGWEIF